MRWGTATRRSGSRRGGVGGQTCSKAVSHQVAVCASEAARRQSEEGQLRRPSVGWRQAEAARWEAEDFPGDVGRSDDGEDAPAAASWAAEDVELEGAAQQTGPVKSGR